MQKTLRIQTQNPSLGKTVLFEGPLEINGRQICCKENAGGADLRIDIYEDGLKIRRRAKDIETTLLLKESGSHGEIKGEEGTFELTDIRFLEYRKTEGYILLRYFLGEEFAVTIEEIGVTNVDKKSIDRSGI